MQGLNHEGVASETGAPGSPIQLLAEVRLQADAGGGGEHVVQCVATNGNVKAVAAQRPRRWDREGCR